MAQSDLSPSARNRHYSTTRGAWLPRLAALVALCAALLLLAACDLEMPAGQSARADTPGLTPTATAVSVAPTAESDSTPLAGAPAAAAQGPTPAAPPDAPPSTAGAQQPAPGQSPSPAATTYTVQDGDTLSGIAERFDTTVDALMQANHIDSADLIMVGQTLQIVPPGSYRAEIVPTSPPAGETAVAVVAPTKAVPPAPTPTVPALRNTTAPLAPTSTLAAVTEASPTEPAAIAQAPTPDAPAAPVVVNGHTYNAYLQAASKTGQWFHYTCEFDAAWVVFKTYGFDVTMDQQLALIGQDKSIEPHWEETAQGIVIYGGDVFDYYSGDYKTNFLARTTGSAMRKVFEHYGLQVTAVHDQASLEAALRRGELVWIKTTADFKPGRPSTWVMPDGRTYQTVLGNDHAVVVIGYNSQVAVIRDVLGPTSTNWQRKTEYEVPWSTFLAAWGSQSYDGLAVAPPGR